MLVLVEVVAVVVAVGLAAAAVVAVVVVVLGAVVVDARRDSSDVAVLDVVKRDVGVDVEAAVASFLDLLS